MKTAIFSFTHQGTQLSLTLKRELETQQYTVTCYTTKDFLHESPELQLIEPDLNACMKMAFNECSLLIFVGASGIAVRSIAPFIQDKRHDPAVICIDEKAQFVIPLLSGHIGGANRISLTLAKLLHAQPIITTATDINGLLAIDEWATRNHLVISDMKVAKQISAQLLRGGRIGLTSDFEISGGIPEHFRYSVQSTALSTNNVDYEAPDNRIGVCISYNDMKKPYETTLNLIPKFIYLGIGCRKGVGIEQIESHVFATLKHQHISIKALAGIATIDLKKEEMGLLDFAAKYNLPIAFFSAQQLQSVQGNFTQSDFVQQVAGTDNVCERAAVLLSRGQLISKKAANNGVTTALAQKVWRVHFGN